MHRTLKMLAPFARDVEVAYPSWPLGHFFSASRHRPWSRQLADELQHSMKAMDRQFDQVEQEIASAVGAVGGGSSIWPVNPRIEPQIVKEGDQQKYLLNVNMGKEIRPEDLKMKIKDGMMTIEAKKEEVSEDGHHRMYQEVFRKFKLPEGVDGKEVKSHLDANGVLTIEAPLPQKALPEPPAPKSIPIDIQ